MKKLTVALVFSSTIFYQLTSFADDPKVQMTTLNVNYTQTLPASSTGKHEGIFFTGMVAWQKGTCAARGTQGCQGYSYNGACTISSRTAKPSAPLGVFVSPAFGHDQMIKNGETLTIDNWPILIPYSASQMNAELKFYNTTDYADISVSCKLTSVTPGKPPLA